jgi:hypothetical protein
MTMSDSITASDKPTLEAAQQQFEQWRSKRTHREPIPEYLWEAAASLCKTHPITNVCRHLHLSFRELKKRVRSEKKPIQFMELDLSCLSGGWQLECNRADGARLRISAGGHPPVIDVLRQFLS